MGGRFVTSSRQKRIFLAAEKFFWNEATSIRRNRIFTAHGHVDVVSGGEMIESWRRRNILHCKK